MSVLYTDEEIARLLAEIKPLPIDYLARLKMRPKRGNLLADLELTGVDGSEFRIMMRQAEIYPRNFSVILAVRPAGTMNLFRLRRHNGNSHEHRNQIEGDVFRSFHIHQATERYQARGMKEDAYAEPTDRYLTIGGALEAMITDCSFVTTGPEQQTLFGIS